jgi:hypothetical protein
LHMCYFLTYIWAVIRICYIHTSMPVAVLCRCYLMSHMQLIIRINAVLRPHSTWQCFISRTSTVGSEFPLVLLI